jgi:hypothetical protein
MRKIAVLVTALVAVLSVAAVAFAAQVNSYTVTASGSPTKAGTKKKPVAQSVNFNYTIGELSGQRPAIVSRYSIKFSGLRTNGKYFKTCTASKINAAGSDAVCSKAAKVGSGSVENKAGRTDTPSDTSIPCHLDLTLYNAGQGKLTLFLAGGPTKPNPCAIALSVAIPGTFTPVSGGVALRFSVPSSLLHPIPGIDNAVVQVTSSLPRKTFTLRRKHHRARKIGFFESVGGCKAGKRPVAVTFTQEDGTVGTKTTSAACKK